MSKKPLSADLVAAYRATEYRVAAQEPFTLHVDQHSKALAQLYRDTGNSRASFMTAENPFSAPASAAARPDVAWPAATSSTSLPSPVHQFDERLHVHDCLRQPPSPLALADAPG
jgi:hypothetical protein